MSHLRILGMLTLCQPLGEVMTAVLGNRNNQGYPNSPFVCDIHHQSLPI